MTNLKISYWPIARLHAFAGNARNHSEEQLAEIAKSIQRFGFVNPVLVDPDGEIIAGHGRASAAQIIGLDKVPVIVLADLSNAEKRALRLADNRIAENSTWDEKALRAELMSLQDMDVDLEGIGFDAEELDRLMAEVDGILPDDPYQAKPAAAAKENAATEDDGAEDVADDTAAEPVKPAEPKASDDDYSMFELVMLHENKIRLVECLSRIRAEHMYDKLEDALMHLVREHEGDPIA